MSHMTNTDARRMIQKKFKEFRDARGLHVDEVVKGINSDDPHAKVTRAHLNLIENGSVHDVERAVLDQVMTFYRLHEGLVCLMEFHYSIATRKGSSRRRDLPRKNHFPRRVAAGPSVRFAARH